MSYAKNSSSYSVIKCSKISKKIKLLDKNTSEFRYVF